LVPRHLEQDQNAHNLQQQQVARILNLQDPENLPRIIREAVSDHAWQGLSQDLARGLNARRPFSCIHQLVDKAKALAA
jgi:UDP-N-acetylglucosamine:LPS N-acetylglucosamine transferase